MKVFRVALNFLVTAMAAVVVGLLAYQGMGGAAAASSWVPAAVGVLDAAAVLATVFNLVAYRRDTGACILTALPALALVAAVIGKVLGHEPPPAALLVYDFYLIYWYAYLLVYEKRRHSSRRW